MWARLPKPAGRCKQCRNDKKAYSASIEHDLEGVERGADLTPGNREEREASDRAGHPKRRACCPARPDLVKAHSVTRTFTSLGPGWEARMPGSSSPPTSCVTSDAVLIAPDASN